MGRRQLQRGQSGEDVLIDRPARDPWLLRFVGILRDGDGDARSGGGGGGRRGGQSGDNSSQPDRPLDPVEPLTTVTRAGTWHDDRVTLVGLVGYVRTAGGVVK